VQGPRERHAARDGREREGHHADRRLGDAGRLRRGGVPGHGEEQPAADHIPALEPDLEEAFVSIMGRR